MTSDSKALLTDIAIPKVPPIPETYTGRSYHKRGKSSLSSLKRFLPKPFPHSRPLSMDPQIRALSNPDAAFDIEKQVVMPFTPKAKDQADENDQEEPSKEEPEASTTSTALKTTAQPTAHLTISKPEGHTRTMTMNSADAPEVVNSSPEPAPAPSPAKIRRSQTATLTSSRRSVHHPHHPNYTPTSNTLNYPLTQRQNTTILAAHTAPLRRSSSRQTQAQHMSMTSLPSRGPSYQFDQAYIPRHTQSQYQPAYYARPTRWASQPSLYEHSRAIPRRNDVEVIYPSTRRARSSTHGILNGPLSCIMESTGDARASAEDVHSGVETQRNALEQNTYRGANRTSMIFY